jgi:hypothetical protein
MHNLGELLDYFNVSDLEKIEDFYHGSPSRMAVWNKQTVAPQGVNVCTPSHVCDPTSTGSSFIAEGTAPRAGRLRK